MLNVEHLSVNYGYITALTDISFHVEEGEIITLIGSNGAGKTTTLGAISGLVPKVSGRITFKGHDITKMPPDKVVKMGMCHVPEGRKIFPALTVYENLIAGSLGNPKLTKARINELVEEQYTLFPRLKERIGQAGGSLSGGEQQMLAMGRALMSKPRILLLDEPSMGLSPLFVGEIFKIIEEVSKAGTTVLLVEQNAKKALSIADRGYVLETGKIVKTGKASDLLNDDSIKKAYLGE